MYKIFSKLSVQQTWASVIFKSTGIVQSGCILAFERVQGRLEWCGWQLLLLLSAKGAPRPLCNAAAFVFWENSCTPRSFRKKSHISDATDLLVVWTLFPVFHSRKFEWQTRGDNSRQGMSYQIRPTLLICEDSTLMRLMMWLKYFVVTCKMTC